MSLIISLLREVPDMPTAFGQAMLATINGHPQHFRMTMQDGPSIEMDCQDFLSTREDEDRLLDVIELPDDGVVLDWGCGAGRHLLRVRQRHPSVECYGIDICDLLLEYCRRTINPPSEFVRTFEELPDREFDLIMLMGNGLGVLGGESEATRTLKRLVESLRPGGRIIIETGNPLAGYFATQFEIVFHGHHNGPFTWGSSDRPWIEQTLTGLGCRVTIQPSSAPGGMFFFAVGQKPPLSG
jgi:SAM-dependent methyltransferase